MEGVIVDHLLGVLGPGRPRGKIGALIQGLLEVGSVGSSRDLASSAGDASEQAMGDNG